MKPLVSVIITCYNQSDVIEKSIQSVLSQTYEEIECIVIDDGSTDGSGEVIKNIMHNDERLKYYYKTNGGVASARNYGVKKSKGEWIQFLDGDDWLNTEKIGKQLFFARQKPLKSALTVIYSDYKIIYENNEGKVWKTEAVKVSTLNDQQILKKIISLEFGEWPPILINSILLSRVIFDSIQFNEKMINTEDLDFYYRLMKKGCNCIYVPITSMYYRQNQNGKSTVKSRQMRGYTTWLERVLAIDRNDLKYFPNMSNMMENCIVKNYNSIYKRQIEIVKKSKIPIYIGAGKIKLNFRWSFYILYKLGIFDKLIKFNYVYITKPYKKRMIK